MIYHVDFQIGLWLEQYKNAPNKIRNGGVASIYSCKKNKKASSICLVENNN